jgi:hypothetical protein
MLNLNVISESYNINNNDVRAIVSLSDTAYITIENDVNSYDDIVIYSNGVEVYRYNILSIQTGLTGVPDSIHSWIIPVYKNNNNENTLFVASAYRYGTKYHLFTRIFTISQTNDSLSLFLSNYEGSIDYISSTPIKSYSIENRYILISFQYTDLNGTSQNFISIGLDGNILSNLSYDLYGQHVLLNNLIEINYSNLVYSLSGNNIYSFNTISNTPSIVIQSNIPSSQIAIPFSGITSSYIYNSYDKSHAIVRLSRQDSVRYYSEIYSFDGTNFTLMIDHTYVMEQVLAFNSLSNIDRTRITTSKFYTDGDNYFGKHIYVLEYYMYIDGTTEYDAIVYVDNRTNKVVHITYLDPKYYTKGLVGLTQTRMLCYMHDINSGNNVLISDTFNYNYLSKPVITIIGGNENIPTNRTYIDKGATAFDEVYGDITSSIVVTNNIDTSVAGSQFVKYDVVNADGISADTATRQVDVFSLPLSYTPLDGITNNNNVLTTRDGNTILFRDISGVNNISLFKNKTLLHDISITSGSISSISNIFTKINNVDSFYVFIDFATKTEIHEYSIYNNTLKKTSTIFMQQIVKFAGTTDKYVFYKNGNNIASIDVNTKVETQNLINPQLYSISKSHISSAFNNSKILMNVVDSSLNEKIIVLDNTYNILAEYNSISFDILNKNNINIISLYDIRNTSNGVIKYSYVDSNMNTIESIALINVASDNKVYISNELNIGHIRSLISSEYSILDQLIYSIGDISISMTECSVRENFVYITASMSVTNTQNNIVDNYRGLFILDIETLSIQKYFFPQQAYSLPVESISSNGRSINVVMSDKTTSVYLVQFDYGIRIENTSYSKSNTISNVKNGSYLSRNIKYGKDKIYKKN